MMTSEEVVADLREYALHAHASAWRARDGGHDYTMGAMLADNAADALEALAASVVALEAALGDIARQKRTDEIDTEYDAEVADFEGGYDACIDRARAALDRATVAAKGETDDDE